MIPSTVSYPQTRPNFLVQTPTGDCSPRTDLSVNRLVDVVIYLMGLEDTSSSTIPWQVRLIDNVARRTMKTLEKFVENRLIFIVPDFSNCSNLSEEQKNAWKSRHLHEAHIVVLKPDIKRGDEEEFFRCIEEKEGWSKIRDGIVYIPEDNRSDLKHRLTKMAEQEHEELKEKETSSNLSIQDLADKKGLTPEEIIRSSSDINLLSRTVAIMAGRKLYQAKSTSQNFTARLFVATLSDRFTQHSPDSSLFSRILTLGTALEAPKGYKKTEEAQFLHELGLIPSFDNHLYHTYLIQEMKKRGFVEKNDIKFIADSPLTTESELKELLDYLIGRGEAGCEAIKVLLASKTQLSSQDLKRYAETTDSEFHKLALDDTDMLNQCYMSDEEWSDYTGYYLNMCRLFEEAMGKQIPDLIKTGEISNFSIPELLKLFDCATERGCEEEALMLLAPDSITLKQLLPHLPRLLTSVVWRGCNKVLGRLIEILLRAYPDEPKPADIRNAFGEALVEAGISIFRKKKEPKALQLLLEADIFDLSHLENALIKADRFHSIRLLIQSRRYQDISAEKLGEAFASGEAGGAEVTLAFIRSGRFHEISPNDLAKALSKAAKRDDTDVVGLLVNPENRFSEIPIEHLNQLLLSLVGSSYDSPRANNIVRLILSSVRGSEIEISLIKAALQTATERRARDLARVLQNAIDAREAPAEEAAQNPSCCPCM